MEMADGLPVAAVAGGVVAIAVEWMELKTPTPAPPMTPAIKSATTAGVFFSVGGFIDKFL